jgi:GTP cyclohydrolase I
MAPVASNTQIDWETVMVDTDRIQKAALEILEAIGEDPEREGLRETPARVARFWQEFINYDCGNTDITFECVTTDQMVVVTGMRVWSLCEHHLLPFWCDVSIGYIAREKVLGLSKFARVAHQCSHRLQIQERLVHQIADEVERLTGSSDVTVFASGQHLCMVMRGIKTEGMLKTSVTRGVFRDDPNVRMEFLRLIAS